MAKSPRDNDDDDNGKKAKPEHPRHPEHPHGGPPGQEDKPSPKARTVSDEINAQNPNDPQVRAGMEQRQEMERRQKVEQGGKPASDKQRILELYEQQGASDDTVILNIQGMTLRVGDLR